MALSILKSPENLKYLKWGLKVWDREFMIFLPLETLFCHSAIGFDAFESN